MKIINTLDAFKILNQPSIINIPFKTLFNMYGLEDVRLNKGRVGQLLENIIGKKTNNALMDFSDGDLKTNKSHSNGKPKETMAISQINSNIDDLLRGIHFKDSWVFKKIDNLVYLPVVKEDLNPENWYFQGCYYISLKENPKIYNQLKFDFDSICSQLKTKIIQNNGPISTTNGKYIQIRTKDTKPYHPIYSNLLGRYVSNKNYAFYFKPEFMMEVQMLSKNK